jgi:hypothetical protein
VAQAQHYSKHGLVTVAGAVNTLRELVYNDITLNGSMHAWVAILFQGAIGFDDEALVGDLAAINEQLEMDKGEGAARTGDTITW